MTLPVGVKIQYSPIDQALAGQIAAAGDWLGEAEQAELARLRDAARRNQWLAARWVAKQMLRDSVGTVALRDVQILARDGRGRGVRPRVVARSNEVAVSLSISHSERGVLAAMAKTNWYAVGVDLVAPAVALDESFRRLWFSSIERQWSEHDIPRRAAIVWAVKEAVYKAANAGQSWNPRQVELRPRGTSGFECSYRGRPLGGLQIELLEFEGQTAAVVSLARATTAWQSARGGLSGPARVSKFSPQSRFVISGR